MENLEKMIDIKLMCSQIIEKVDEIINDMDLENVNLDNAVDGVVLKSDDDVSFEELSSESEFHTEDELEEDEIAKALIDLKFNNPDEEDEVALYKASLDVELATEDDELNDAIALAVSDIENSSVEDDEDDEEHFKTAIDIINYTTTEVDE